MHVCLYSIHTYVHVYNYLCVCISMYAWTRCIHNVRVHILLCVCMYMHVCLSYTWRCVTYIPSLIFRLHSHVCDPLRMTLKPPVRSPQTPTTNLINISQEGIAKSQHFFRISKLYSLFFHTYLFLKSYTHRKVFSTMKWMIALVCLWIR